MNTKALKIVRHLFSCPDIPREHNRSYQRQWVRMVRMLGDKWPLAKTVHLSKQHRAPVCQ